MKYIKWFLSSLFVFTSLNMMACDLCSMYMSMYPNDYQNSITFIYRRSVFEGIVENPFHHHDEAIPNGRVAHIEAPVNSEAKDITEQEQYNSYEVQGTFYINKKLYLQFTAGFADNYMLQDDSITANVAGVKDISTILNYHLMSSKADTSKSFAHRLTIGAGVKLPVGNYQKKTISGYEMVFEPGEPLGAEPVLETDQHMQPGTGSIDLLMNLGYVLRYKWSGLFASASYRYNTSNKNDFRFANRFNTSANLFAEVHAGKLTILPLIGCYYETANRDWQGAYNVINTGGESFFGTAGLKINYKKIALDGTFYRPLIDNLWDEQLPNKYRTQIRLSVFI